MGLSRLFYKETRVLIQNRDGRFLAGVFYDGVSASLVDILQRWPELEPLKRYLSDGFRKEWEIPIHLLNDFLQLVYSLQSSCAKFKKILIDIRPEARRARILNTPPSDFVIFWRWTSGFLALDYGPGIVELAEGWYRRGDEYWRYPVLSSADVERMRRVRVERQDLLAFLTKDLPTYEGAGVKCACELSYSPVPALELSFETVERDLVRIEQKWNIPPESVDADFDLFGYVLANRMLQRGMRPNDLRAHLSFDIDFATLKGIEIARFMDRHYASVKHWFPDVRPFESAHPWIEPPYEWILVATAEPERGVGKATASPMALVGGEEFAIEALIHLMREPYAHLARGWVRRTDLMTLGIDPSGEWMGKGRFNRVRLEPCQIVCRGDAHIDGPWSRLELRGAPWATSPQKQAAAREHLRFLLEWGVSGGLTGGYESALAYASRMIADLFAREESAKVLVVGSKADIEEYAVSVSAHRTAPISQYGALKPSTAYLVAYDALSRSAAPGIVWDLLVIIEPDALYSDEGRAAYRAIYELLVTCRIGFFANRTASLSDPIRQLMKSVLKLNASDEVLSCLVQDPRKLAPLPPAYIFRNKPAARADEGFEVVLQGKASSGTAIPPRAAVPQVSVKVAASPARVQMTGAMSGEAFLREARKMATVGGAVDAEPVPFACYWPKYADMNALQKKWYFHLRGLIRRGQYPDTDLSYLFVHIYELLNGIGCDNLQASYDELMAIWSNYRDRHPKLDKYLSEWMFDFLVLKKPGASMLDFVEVAPAVPREAVDCALMEFDPASPLLLPLPALELLSGYGIRQSKFYLSGYREVVEKVLPRAVALVDSRMREGEGAGILSKHLARPVTTQRFAFSSAVVEREETYKLTCVPYSDIPACKDLVSQILRYAENALRARFQFSSKLRGITLAKPYSDWIDAYLARQFEKKQAPQPEKPTAKVALDASAIEKLRGESDEVRDALIASMEEAESAEDAAREEFGDFDIPIRPADAPEGMLTDLAPVSRILRAATADERRMLTYLQKSLWEVNASQIGEAFAGILVEAEIDAVNALSVRHLGVQLVEREGDRFVVADDYRDELEYLLEHPQEEQASAWMVVPDGLEPDWAAFFSEADLDALGAALEGGGALEALASERGEMPDLLVDALNAASMEAIGDLVLDGNTIAEDYVPLIQEHLKKTS